MALRILFALAAIAGLWALAVPVQPAHSAGTLSLTGSWTWQMSTPVGQCVGSASIVHSGSSLSIDFSCFVYVPMLFGVSGSTTGSIDPETGAFTTSGPDATSYHLSGVASKNEQLGGQSISGVWYCCNGSVAGGFSGYLPPPQPTATPSPTIPGPVASTPTATPTTTPPPVGGLATDAPSGGSPTYAGWLAATAGAAFVAVASAAAIIRRKVR